jgi:hypothetical protein
MILSLGNSCKVKEAIQRYTNVKSQSQFFDWMLSNFDSVLYFMKNINTPIHGNNFYLTNEQYYEHKRLNHLHIRFDSLHDILCNQLYEIEKNKFIEKYNRRLIRFKNNIIDEKIIHFIHLVDFIPNPILSNKPIYIPTIEEIKLFDKYIKNINPTCNYYLHILIPPQNCKYYKYNFEYDKNEILQLSSKNIFIYFLSQDHSIDSCNEQCHHWSWSDVFENIKNVISTE